MELWLIDLLELSSLNILYFCFYTFFFNIFWPSYGGASTHTSRGYSHFFLFFVYTVYSTVCNVYIYLFTMMKDGFFFNFPSLTKSVPPTLAPG